MSVRETGSTRHDSRERIVDAVGLTKTFTDFWLRSTAKAVDGIDFHIDRH